jgi:TatD DNase family protein
MKLVDGHCHLANLDKMLPVGSLLSQAAEAGIGAFLSSALTREEVEIHLGWTYPGVYFSAGIHPNYDECDLALDDIARLCEAHSIWAVGEIGLDRNGPLLDTQLELFEAQLQLAERHRLPAVLHIVGHQQLAYETMRKYGLRYLVHGYAGSLEGYRLFSRLDSYFTISERILRPDKLGLLKEMAAGERFLLETDMTRHYVHPGEENPLLRLPDVFRQAASLCGMAPGRMLEIQYMNYKALLGEQA